VNGTPTSTASPPPRPGRAHHGGFWEVNTAAHIDEPQHARIVELVDNGDGTLSIFGTLIDHAGPVRPSYDDLGPLALAGHARELSYNDPQASEGKLGGPGDRNVELLLKRPFDRTPTPAPPADRPAPAPAPSPDPPASAPAARALPATGGAGLATLGGAAAIAAAASLRARDRGERRPAPR
jgi:hypothetical protein